MEKEDKNKHGNNDKKNDKNIIIYIIGTEIVTSINNVTLFIQYGITAKLFIIILLYWIEKYKNNYNINDLNQYTTAQSKKPSVYFVSVSYLPTPSSESYILALPITEEEFIIFLGVAFAFNQIVEEPEEVVAPEIR
ncbi:hypothetical protein U732_899 [Clostridium argentinense CDC 2741]|uniref:Uncharacterized protein n=1 Tax=Clostridium argentinense CDC 2741 TaxID=1418104 RepID=A0A0C1TVM9_9CLOT|nr:hypothetical protein [Clostridium argentinense]ARC84351.1 hypothetical protein RSJ17_07295 [Clostridium argentinense]KIE44789.1 hypothetical protein U732_899 [Clostridium argentinense CDC 2741]NFF38319.1 hypothetical protein [Clostridium argentinense]NFP49097.1 hypothetical protein [Clostridium argentinense]NFP71623.1 hypothetical protein [Clostridium argentinense]